ncbi:hypothetical protein M117_2293 [Bacteroides fragilis str. 3774 T13]|nr:hypothetical protein M117_2293 [Bacteroides fragilis str. 3774 T13]
MQRIANNTFLLFFNEIKLLQFHSSALFLCYCRYRVETPPL